MEIFTYVLGLFVSCYISAGCFLLATYHGISATNPPGADSPSVIIRFISTPIYVAFWPMVFLWEIGFTIGRRVRARRVAEKLALAESEE